MDALQEARNSLSSFQSQFNDEGKVYALDAIASALIAIAERLEGIDNSLHTLQEVAQWSESGKDRNAELREAEEWREYEKETLNRAGWASNEEYESSPF